MICILAISKVPRFKLASVAEQAGLSLAWSQTPEDTFSHDVPHLISCTPFIHSNRRKNLVRKKSARISFPQDISP